MDIHQIWGRDPGSGEVWLIDAWDDDSISVNRDEYNTVLQKAVAENGFENTRVVVTTVDIDAVLAAFEPVRVGSTTK